MWTKWKVDVNVLRHKSEN